MNKFTDLIINRTYSKPENHEEWTDRIFPNLIAESNFTIWQKGNPIPDKGVRYLLGVALWDKKELELLDLLDEYLSSKKSAEICLQVFNFSDIKEKSELENYIPTILSTPSYMLHPPVLGIWKDGILQKTASHTEVKRILTNEFKD